jgi:hypothetical protein
MLSRCEMCSSRYVLVKSDEPERSSYEVWEGRLDVGKATEKAASSACKATSNQDLESDESDEINK